MLNDIVLNSIIIIIETLSYRKSIDGVRIRLKRGGHHGSESVSHRGVHHAFEFFRNCF